ncbi:MAG TPA: protein kinase [Terriglobales bacterium]|nr:protein kinase [Terriglobales bacterium]
MTPERWAQVKQAFQSALELAPDERAIYLDGFCAAEPELRKEVESLLRHHHEAGTVMDHPAKIITELIPGDENDPWIGRNIGPYQTVSKIGQGGMGTVYRAIRVDDHYLKNVAIKLARSGMAAGRYLRRFRSERQIMASLDHPNIARLLDGGTTEEGIPYLVMEYIEGQPIDAYCDSRSLNTVARLKLFCQVCSAVQYAHQSLVIHRDLKPGNILVTSDGIPKLLDFGIAKLLDPELFFQTVEAGGTMMKAMTPEYASPEQVRGDAITTVSDVYSLGVVLYRLLTGHPPYQIDTTSPLEIVRAITELQPSKPSTVIDRVSEFTGDDGRTVQLNPEAVSKVRDGRSAVLKRKLTGDIDNIILKALRKEPGRRYSSVEQFADDIRRYLNGLPVGARADTIFYRTGKFVRRNKVSVTAAVLVLLSLMTGIVLTVRQAHIAQAERARAERRFNDVRKLAHDLIFDVHDSIEYLPGATPARKLIVEDALSYLDSLAKESSGDVGLQDELATAYEKIGDVQGASGKPNLGDTAGALVSYRKALEIRENILAAKPHDNEALAGAARSYMRMSEVLEGMGKYDESLQLAQKNLEIRKQLLALNPNNEKAQAGLAAGYDNLGSIQTELAQWEAKIQNHHASAELYKALADSHPENYNYLRDAALEHKKIGGVLEFQGRLDEALQEDEYALKIDDQTLAKHPEDVTAHRDIGVDYSSVGDVLFKKGNYKAALERYRQALAVDERLVIEDPKDAWGQSYIVYDSYRVADALMKTGEQTAALALYAKTITKAQTNAANDPTNVQWQAELARVYGKFAAAHESMTSMARSADGKKHLNAALDNYRKSVSIWQDLRKNDSVSGGDVPDADAAIAGLAKCEAIVRSDSATQR